MSISYYLHEVYNNNIIINVSNEHLINFYNVVKNNKGKLIDKIKSPNTVFNNKFIDMLEK